MCRCLALYILLLNEDGLGGTTGSPHLSSQCGSIFLLPAFHYLAVLINISMVAVAQIVTPKFPNMWLEHNCKQKEHLPRGGWPTNVTEGKEAAWLFLSWNKQDLGFQPAGVVGTQSWHTNTTLAALEVCHEFTVNALKGYLRQPPLKVIWGRGYKLKPGWFLSSKGLSNVWRQFLAHDWEGDAIVI